VLVLKKKLKILDFDIENRPLTYWADRPSAEITAIASCWSDDIKSMEVLLLGREEPTEILKKFVARYNEADIVTGHYIRRHDLPIINGALMEYNIRPLKAKLTSDTRLDLIKKGDIPATQEYLSELLGLPVSKVAVSQHDWRQANRLTEEGLKITEKRVSGDVLQHILLREELIKRRLIGTPKIWKPR
jgi:hypothetical protein